MHRAKRHCLVSDFRVGVMRFPDIKTACRKQGRPSESRLRDPIRAGELHARVPLTLTLRDK